MSGASTRQELISVAERLFAERGIEGPSLREITREAGQRNSGALQYHFGGREGLLKAVMDKHEPGIDIIQHGLLDQQELAGAPTLSDLAAVLVLPYIPKLKDPDGGPEYLQIKNELLHRPALSDMGVAPMHPGSSLYRWSLMVEPLLPPEGVGRPLHRRYVAHRFACGELARRARQGQGHDHRLFSSHLIDVVTGVLGAPISPATKSLIRPRHDQTPDVAETSTAAAGARPPRSTVKATSRTRP